jgi:hypothetical protein
MTYGLGILSLLVIVFHYGHDSGVTSPSLFILRCNRYPEMIDEL